MSEVIRYDFEKRGGARGSEYKANCDREAFREARLDELTTIQPLPKSRAFFQMTRREALAFAESLIKQVERELSAE